MLTSVEGVYRDGRIDLLESPGQVGAARVIVTFLPTAGVVDLPARGIHPADAADLLGRLRSFAEDWDRPDMDAYDAL